MIAIIIPNPLYLKKELDASSITPAIGRCSYHGYMQERFNQAKAIVLRLARAGYTAYFAGGWVRDYVMGHPSEDIDIATNAPPYAIMDLFTHTNLVGLAFGVVIVSLEGHSFEVATFRKDLKYIDGRHPEGIEMSNPVEDALRRDFTINGMFFDPVEERIHDFVHGQEDIQRGLIRTIGNPHERFYEDRLRMLRAFRFSARFGFAIDPETQEAIRENSMQLFPAVAMERVWQELSKMALYPRFDQALMEMHRLEILEVILPEIKGLHIKELQQYVTNFAQFPSECPPLLYLMELLPSHSLEEKSEIAKRLKVSNKEIKNLEFLHHLSQAVEQDAKEVDLHRWAHLFANPDWKWGIALLALRLGEGRSGPFSDRFDQRYQQLKEHVQRIKTGRPLVSAALLQEQGIKPGKLMGVLLKEAERLAINQDLNESGAVLKKLSQLPIWSER